MANKVIQLQPAFNPINPKRGEDKERHGFDLYSIPGLRQVLLWKHSRTVFQSILLVAALAVIYDGFFGSQLSPRNFATVGAWVDYRFLLVMVILLVGNLFCMACPFVLVSHSIQKRVGLNRVWPRWLKGKWISLGLLILILFSYEQFSLWDSPALTASVTLLYFGGAAVTDFIFKGNAFCKYVCPLGLFNQTYAMLSPTEVKSRSFTMCKSCTTKECIKGDDKHHQEGCQMSLYMGTKVSNMDCTYQMSCARACPYSNVGLQVRNPIRELWTNVTKRDFSLGVVALVLAFAALTNAGSMIGPFTDFQRWVGNTSGLRDNFSSYTLIFFFFVVALPGLTGWLVTWLTRKLARSQESLGSIFKRFALGLLPVSFSFWIAHYLFHFSVGAKGFWPTVQNLFVRLGIPIFGPPNYSTGTILPYEFINPLQIFIIYVGLMCSGVALYQISRKMYKKKVARLASLPFIGLAILLAVVAVLIMVQPMQARGA
ncbi:MAG: 4Fe-4S ferredoxin iron-sulfur binding protein [Chloroflexi bacterium]|nr:4Fe-4S ferredoxin iron-sulfur binding protein [Chloroflexota bacterium]